MTQALIFAGFDLPRDREADIIAWHSEEHLPERLALPGFRRGRRYRSSTAAPKYLVLYELEALSVMESPAYIERLNNPTPWTSRSVSQFQNNFRSCFQVLLQEGRSRGGFVTFFALPEGAERVAPEAGAGRVTFARCDIGRSSIHTTEAEAIRNRVMTGDIVLVEADSREELGRLSRPYLVSAEDEPPFYELDHLLEAIEV